MWISASTVQAPIGAFAVRGGAMRTLSDSNYSNRAAMSLAVAASASRMRPPNLLHNPTVVQEAPSVEKDIDELSRTIIDRLAFGYMVLDQRYRPIYCNETARTILDGENNEVSRGGQDTYRRGLQELMIRAGGRPSLGALCWIAVSRRTGIAEVLCEVLECGPAGTSIVILLDLDACAQPSTATLQRIFGLTPAEASLAIAIARGGTPDKIAAGRRVSRTTVRTQLARVFAKTQTSRQAELVRLLGRIAMLP